jgi:hypothetical protein
MPPERPHKRLLLLRGRREEVTIPSTHRAIPSVAAPQIQMHSHVLDVRMRLFSLNPPPHPCGNPIFSFPH